MPGTPFRPGVFLEEVEPPMDVNVSDTRTQRPSTDHPTLTNRMAERAIETVENTSWLGSIISKIVDAFPKVVGPGTLKDALSGTWLGHPVHPLLTDVTVGAWTSAVALDLFGSEETHAGADALVALGTLSALPTVITGVSELADTEARDERNLGGAHAISNLSATALFALSYVQRRSGRRGLGTALSLGGIAVATVGAYIGGHLSYRRGIGVDRTAFDDAVRVWTRTIKDDDLIEGKAQKVRVGRTDVMLYRTDGRIVALANRCTHRGGPLHKGDVDEGSVTCPWHFSTFRLEDGAIIRGPATAPAPFYETRVNDGVIEVRSA
jgi:nitrite reductase/ring-hydroxylating ferredoxin subunit/uncharacterized membrane protein